MSLDPADWSQVETLSRQMASDMVDYLRTVRDRPVWQTVPEEVKARLNEPVPMAGAPLAEVYEAFKRDVLPYPTGNIHPRFWGWVMGTGSPTAMLADMLASGMNSHLAGYDQSAAVVERQVVSWLKSLMGFPAEASGLLVSGGTAANLNGLMAARVAKAGFDVRELGMAGGPPLRIYASTETHNWINRACETMGMGRQSIHRIGVDAQYAIDVQACRAAIVADLAAGYRPIAIVANCGTVNTGGIDDMAALRQLADEFGLWLHVDGAFRALAVLAPQGKPLVAGMELADSLAFDLHKWGYLPYEVGAVLTRDSQAQLAAWQPQTKGGPAYLRNSGEGISVDTTYFADRDLQLSRGFKALKVWMAFKEQGVDRIGQAISANIDQARYLGKLVEATKGMELLAPVTLNVVCLRLAPEGLDLDAANRLNGAILAQLQVRGIAVPSQTVLGGKFAIRVANTNHRSELSDFDLLLKSVQAIGAELLASGAY
jgi:glutamate/tyrosine decarboxylase-like PLP-dependent enzyme